MIVYRFERRGIGPYMTIWDRNGYDFFHNQPNKHIERRAKRFKREYDFEAMTKAHKNKELLYGCASKEALKFYFGYRFKPLFRAGFRIKKYDVPDDEVIDIGCEVAFPVRFHKIRTKRKLAKRVETARGY